MCIFRFDRTLWWGGCISSLNCLGILAAAFLIHCPELLSINLGFPRLFSLFCSSPSQAFLALPFILKFKILEGSICDPFPSCPVLNPGSAYPILFWKDTNFVCSLDFATKLLSAFTCFTGSTWKSRRQGQNNITSEILDLHLSPSKEIFFSCFCLINSIPVSEARSGFPFYSCLISCPSIWIFNLPIYLLPMDIIPVLGHHYLLLEIIAVASWQFFVSSLLLSQTVGEERLRKSQSMSLLLTIVQ